MEPVMSVVKQIWDFEGFCVKFLDLETDTALEEYNAGEWTNRFSGKKTVNAWIRIRFKKRYGDLKIQVLNGDGSPVRGNTLIKNLRSTYESYEDEEVYEDTDEDDWDD